MGFEQELCQEAAKTSESNAVATGCDSTSKLHQEAYEAKGILPVENTASVAARGWFPGNGYDRIAQEAQILGMMLDSGNAQFAQLRLQNDLYSLRPNRYAQNLLLNNVNLYDRKGVGSDLMLGYYNPVNQTFSHGYIIPSVFRPFPTYPVFY